MEWRPECQAGHGPMRPQTDITDAGRVSWWACTEATCPYTVTEEKAREVDPALGDDIQALMQPAVQPERTGSGQGGGGRREDKPGTRRWRLRIQASSITSGEVSPDWIRETRGTGREERFVVSVALNLKERKRLQRLAQVHGTASDALRAGLELLEGVEIGRGRLARGQDE